MYGPYPAVLLRKRHAYVVPWATVSRPVRILTAARDPPKERQLTRERSRCPSNYGGQRAILKQELDSYQLQGAGANRRSQVGDGPLLASGRRLVLYSSYRYFAKLGTIAVIIDSISEFFSISSARGMCGVMPHIHKYYARLLFLV